MRHFVLSLLLVGIFTIAKADVIGPGEHFLRVTANEEIKQVTFELCNRKNQSCRPMGSRTKGVFSFAQLAKEKNKRQLQFVGTLLADAALVAGGATAGWYAGGPILAFFGTSQYTSAVIGSIGGSIIGGVLGITAQHFIESVNPFARYQSIRVVSKKVITDTDITLDTEEKFNSFAERLERVLNSIQ